jgi:mono/diheme cytochrome c family protein
MSPATRPAGGRRRWGLLVAVAAAMILALAIWTRGMGVTTRMTPSALETRLAYAARHWATPAEARSRANPVPRSPDVIEAGMAHWADHCASCHANDGSGDTSLGRSFYPPVPDMRSGRSQALSDGALFYAIEQGIPFTGMPAWGNGTKEGEHASWELVWFIRHLPALTPEDITRMEALNPKTAAQLEMEQLMRDFLKGGG